MPEIYNRRGEPLPLPHSSGGRTRRRRVPQGAAESFPHDLEAERALLGACLVNNESVSLLPPTLRPEHFYRKAHQAVFRAIEGLAAKGSAIDFVTLKDALTATGELDTVGGPIYISGLTDGVPRSSNIASYAANVLEKYAARKMLLALDDASNALRTNPSAALNGLPDRTNADLARIRESVISTATIRVSESLPDVLARLADVPPRTMVVQDLIALGEITLLHGQPRDGKTWVALEIAIAVTTGSSAFGLERCDVPRERRALIIGNEDTERATVERLRLLLAGRGFDAAPEGLRLLIGRNVSLDDPEWQTRILDEVRHEGIELVIIDPLRSVSAAVDQGPAELKPLATYLRRLRTETGAAILPVHHDVKPSPNRADVRRRAQKASGGAIFSIVDAPIHVERIDDRRTLLTPDGYKHSTDPVPLIVTREQCGDSIRLIADSTSGTSAADVGLAAKIREFLLNNPNSPGNKVAQGVAERKADVIRVLKAMPDLDSVQAGRARRWFVRTAPAATGPIESGSMVPNGSGTVPDGHGSVVPVPLGDGTTKGNHEGNLSRRSDEVSA